jgi:hypothetical protein
MRKKLLRLLRLVPIAMLFVAGSAAAQTTGNIVGQVTDLATGKPVAGALVIATSPGLQGEQTAITDGGGNYTLTSLPPGRYKVAVQLQGFKPAERTDLVLRVDFTLRANIAIIPEAVQLEEQIVKTGTAPAVNIGSAEAGTIVTREYMATVPTTRTYEQVAVIAPTAQRDQYGVSFGGGSSPENNYIIDGLRVSDPALGTLGTNLLTNFVDQLDVKVGSFMPEYGYSSSGIINTVTKSGGNEFHGSIWGNITPGIFTPATPATSSNGMAFAQYSSPYKGSYNADFGLEVGGPIVKDKLWFYAGFAPQMIYNARTQYLQKRVANSSGQASINSSTGLYDMTPVEGTDHVYGSGSTRYYALAKVTWLVNENHNVFVSFNTQPTTLFGYAYPTGGGTDSSNYYNVTTGNTNVTLNYTGKFFEKHILVNVAGGYYGASWKENGGTVGSVNTLQTPRITWSTAQRLQNFNPGVASICPTSGTSATGLGCWAVNYTTGGGGFYGGYVEDPTTTRFSGNASVTALFNLLGQQQLKGGVQIDYATYDNDRYYSGGATFSGRGVWGGSTALSTTSNAFSITRAYGDRANPVVVPAGNVGAGRTRYTTPCASIDANGNCVNPGLADPSLGVGHSISNTNTWTNGFYLQDSWTIANVLTLNFGVRLDTQKMVNATADANDPSNPQLGIYNMWAPRVQAIWDFTGNGRGKIQANWGQYYESIPLDMALRAFGGERQFRGAYQMSSCNASMNPATNPGGNPFQSGCALYGIGPTAQTVDLWNVGSGISLTSSSYSPLAPDLKGSYTNQFGGGVQYEVIQDLTLGVSYLGRRIGTIIEDMSSDEGNNYYIANPSVSAPWTATAGGYGPGGSCGANGCTFNPQYGTGGDYTTGTNYFMPWPKPERSYDAVTVELNKLFSNKWLAQASYTWSSLRGNYAGLFRWENGQLDPNITSEYDLPGLLGNKSGPLPGNRTHQIKVAGSYFAPVSPTINIIPSVNFSALSGLPISALGYHPIYLAGEAFVLPRGVVGDLPWTYQLDLGGKLTWALGGAYSLQFSLDIFNILNMQTTQWVDQNYTFDSAGIVPLQNAGCANHTSISAKNPLTALREACPDLPYARTVDNRPVNVNLNFGRPQTSGTLITAYQAPISVRFGVALSF